MESRMLCSFWIVCRDKPHFKKRNELECGWGINNFLNKLEELLSKSISINPTVNLNHYFYRQTKRLHQKTMLQWREGFYPVYGQCAETEQQHCLQAFFNKLITRNKMNCDRLVEKLYLSTIPFTLQARFLFIQCRDLLLLSDLISLMELNFTKHS